MAVAGSKTGFSPGAGILWESEEDQIRDLDAVVATHAKHIRLDFPWPSIEPNQGDWNWAPFDSIVSLCTTRGLTVLGVAGYSPNWAEQAVSPGVPPVDPAAFGTFMGAIAARYGPMGVKNWEIWNEPNLSGAWGANPDAAAYTVLLQSGWNAVKAAYPIAKVITGGLAPATDGVSQISPVTFLEGIYAAGGKNYFTHFAVHPYSYPAYPRQEGTESWNTYQRIPLMRDVMVANGDETKQIWLTEFGVPTGTATGAVSESVQALMVPAGLNGHKGWRYVKRLYWYSIRDSGTDLADRESNFGLLRNDFSEKPGYAAFKANIKSPGGLVVGYTRG